VRVTTKRCSGKCHRVRPLTDFTKNAARPDGVEQQCKACRAAYRTEVRKAQSPDEDFGEPRTPKEWEPYTAECFEKFFNRFSGRILAPHCKAWVASALAHKNLLLNVPPRHAKSTIMSVWFPIWLVAKNRNEQIVIVSKTDSLAKKFAREVAAAFESNTELKREFGPFVPSEKGWLWQPLSGQMLVAGRSRETKSGDLTIQIRGAKQQILGMEASWAIVDDVTDLRLAQSEVERNKEREWIQGDVFSRLQMSGHAVVIGQRVHPRDIYGYLSEMTKRKGGRVFDVEKHPAITDWEAETVLWDCKQNGGQHTNYPDCCRSFEALMDAYDRLGSRLFSTMYQQQPLPEGAAFVTQEWIDGCLDRDRVAGQGYRTEDEQGAYLPLVRVLSVDPSPTRYAALVVADVLYMPRTDQFNCVILDIKRDKMGLRETVTAIEEMAGYGPEYLIFEQNSFARWLKEDPIFQSLHGRFRVIGHDTGRNKLDPEYGVHSLSADFELGRIRLPYGDADARHASELLINEALQFPYGDTDDVLMALWFMKARMKGLIPRRYMHGQMRGVSGPGTGAWQEFERTAALA
jgi:hypothetical protein